MNVDIITIFNSKPNYGNRLQNYAIDVTLRKLVDSVETIYFEQGSFVSIKERVKYMLQKITGFKLPGDKKYWKCVIPQRIAFDNFNKEFVISKNVKSLEKARKLKADYFILGSDQVWNPNWYNSDKLKKEMYFLTFTKPEKKICFSPSFGIEALPDKWKYWYKEQLSTFLYISVREESGAKIIKDLIGKEAKVLIDPTMMLDKSEWMRIAKQPKQVDCTKPYILTYFLGDMSERASNDLQEIVNDTEMLVYSLFDETQPEIYSSGPSEFIYMVSNAQLILTDSFHACVFSFLFEKPFMVYAREGKEAGMLSRLDTLLTKFDLQRKYVNSGLENEIFECDYSEGYKRLKTERKKVIDFLENSMSITSSVNVP